ncbi:MAG: Crp/Fnr family transcriptional regulator [Bacteroidota bacterium]
MKSPATFSNKLLQSIDKIAIKRTLAKGELLLKEGDIERNLYYVSSGALRVFLLTEYEEMTIRFGYEGSFINSLSSFITQKPSEFYIEAIRKTTIQIISKDKLQEIIHQNTESMQEYIALIEALVTQQIEREIDLLTISPAERLKRVLARSPNLFQQIPLKYIASYLRMTPETLSRVRNS